MSGINPLLDTLLHDVLGKRIDHSAPRVLNEAVNPVNPTEPPRAVRADSRLEARPAATSGITGTSARGTVALFQAAEVAQADSSGIKASLSLTARMISTILAAGTAQAEPVKASAPLLQKAGAPPLLIATQLENSIVHSGLFYESHVARWYRGDVPRQQLEKQPQMREAISVGQRLESGVAASSGEQDVRDSPGLSQAGASLPVVRQQLELMSNPVLRWEGDIWPGLWMLMTVAVPPLVHGRESGHHGAGDEQEEWLEADTWEVALEFVSGKLGKLDAVLRLKGEELSLELRCMNAETASRLAAWSGTLEGRLRDRGVVNPRLMVMAGETS